MKMLLLCCLLVGAACAADDDVPEAPDAGGECGSPGERCCPTLYPEDLPCNHPSSSMCVENVCVAPVAPAAR